jgi:hypothetical protein
MIDGSSPVFDSVEGFPDSSPERASAFREQVAQLSAFNADVRAARLAPAGEKRAKALEVFEKHGRSRAIQEAVVLEILGLLRDNVGWKETLDYIDALPRRWRNIRSSSSSARSPSARSATRRGPWVSSKS